jgi:hypothetical protein
VRVARGIVAEPPAPPQSGKRVMERIARREAAKPPKRLAQILLIMYDGKISLCYFSLVLFSKSALRLILKIKAALFENIN